MSPLSRVASWRLLLTCFALIALLFAATKVITWLRGRQLHSAIERTMRDALTSAELISRMGRDLDSERQLIDTHILESERTEMTQAEARLSELQRDFADSATAYEPLADQPEELRVWRELQADVAAAQPTVAAVLALSRANRDADARLQLPVLDRRFASIGDQVGRLVTLNRVGVTRALANLDEAQDRLNLIIGGLALLGIALTALVGGTAMGLVYRRERQLTRYSSMLEEQNRELDAFASRVAHDLRGPLTTMRLAVWRLITEAPADHPASASIGRSIERMETLIHDLLALSHIEAQVRDGACDPAAVAATVRDELAPRLESTAATLRLEVEPAGVSCAEGLLAQALANLADNALKYRRADAPPLIVISGRRLDGTYELRVADNGIGMSADESRRAFLPFYRALRDKSASGTGLGLSIVKRIAEANGGDVAVESALGEGTTFVMHLPLRNR